MQVKCAVIGVMAGILLVLLGALLPLAFSTLYDNKLDYMFVLRPDSPSTKHFIEPSITFVNGLYLFNVTNPEDILKGFKPRVQEVGPFTYLERNRKEDIRWDNRHATVTFKKNETFFFSPKHSGSLTEDTLITTLNPTLMTLASMAEDPNIPAAAHGVLEMYLWRFKIEPFITKPAGELLFDGYDEAVIRALAQFTGNPKHKTGKFGWFYQKNGTLSSDVKLHTGADNINKRSVLAEIEGKPQMSAWKTDYCNRIDEKVAAPFPRPIKEDSKLYLFSAGLCRVIYFVFQKFTTLGNLNLFRFMLPYELLAKSKENECFCLDKFTCRDQMAYLAPCRNKVPVVASYPHFYMASEDDIRSIDGLHPEEKLHETFIDVEPTTGLTVRGFKRAQINMPLKRYAELPSFSQVREVIFPILWMDFSFEISPANVDLLYSSAILPGIIVTYVCYGLIALGAIVILAIIIIYCKTTKKQPPDNKPKQKKKDVKLELHEPFIQR